MTKDELAAEVEKRIIRSNPDMGVTQKVAKAVIDAAMGAISDEVAGGKNVYLRGFGSFGPKLRQAKIARNIAAGTPLQIPAHYIPEFTPSNEFKAIVRNAQPLNK